MKRAFLCPNLGREKERVTHPAPISGSANKPQKRLCPSRARYRAQTLQVQLADTGGDDPSTSCPRRLHHLRRLPALRMTPIVALLCSQNPPPLALRLGGPGR